ncbi:alpha/beta fold hydrolase [Candidatus Nucleicultrix amoebiphila]|jgi:pimeloyl-ACP methyl ester carboxylesterase|uniref:AB hydrolase-1 domain-containing protein n=1 Tax=Candidatus Nucleicultrix amoebiphila FS5 TaxID=1414854 RepID=A0A1W6N2T2_9PROT|nr:alpha/beta hydrolase [Candidatus Nucleicultrix amoebiphila]ARN84118.1 hypothetical protein GQ61_00795 [Candidatus Nucleicultrix amoebiphila FS5]
MTIAYKKYGSGNNHVIVLHDWFSDSSSYDMVLPYLDTDQFCYVFPDLRGYGKSKTITGECSVDEAAQDVIAVADTLKWEKFHLIGHSMSGMIVQYINTLVPERVQSVIAITPVPACGSKVPEEMVMFITQAANDNDMIAEQIIGFMTSGRHSDVFYKEKVKKWRESSVAEARLAYLHMFSDTDFSSKMKGLKTPYLVIIGAHDGEAYGEEVQRKTLQTWLPQAELQVIQNSGHYPMQETPVYLATLINNFLRKQL